MASPNFTIIFEAGGRRYVTTEAIPFQSQDNTCPESQLVTVFANHDGVVLSKAWLETYLNKLDGCDVYDRNLFLSGVIITTPHRGQAVPQDSWKYLKELGMKWLDVVVEGDEVHLPKGPYLYTDNKLHPVYRLYDDEKGAFFSGLKSKLDLSPSTVFEQLGVASTSNNCLAAAVPSRASTLVANALPNLRVAVKDCFLVRGMKKSLCNRAYYELSEPATFTADVIQVLIDDGAYILGLTKLSSMIAREEPMNAVDYSTTFNIRGDGYQSPAGSSSGSAAAVAAYTWLDCASVSNVEHEEATRRLLVYRKWLHNQFFGDENFETFVILPVADVRPVYRDEKLESPETQSPCDQLFLPPILGSPDVVIPIGETPYHSKISNRTEYLPVLANLVAAPGRDHELLKAVDTILERSGRSQMVYTGSRTFLP
ncbi:hypothetical protein LB506_010060 [Fusarium annulatum]|nr:hypothetical protein LB506_010060 [Fusarium annulatum]